MAARARCAAPETLGRGVGNKLRQRARINRILHLPEPPARDRSLRGQASSFAGIFRYIVAAGIGGAEEEAVPLARDLHPEFGYVGSAPRLFRRLGLVLSFVAFGLIAAASGVAVFTADPDPDPLHAMALAPADAVKGATLAPQTAAVETKAAQAPLAQKTSKAGAIKSPCRGGTR